MSDDRDARPESVLDLDIPAGVTDATQAVELIRAWVADGALLVSLNADAFGDRMADWGRLLSELAQHIAKAAALQGHMAEGEAEAMIRQAFTASGLIQAGQTPSRVSEGKIDRTKH